MAQAKAKRQAKNRGGDKSFSSTNTINPPDGAVDGQTREPYEQDVKRRIGQFGGEGEPPPMKK